ncbi:UNVERIFIED_CONTAM: hypothetical protein RMT77_015071 [Armadillidium vulgare]
MNFKSEIEIKEEELDLEYDFYNQTSQNFPHSESNIPLAESIKKELDENSSFIKSEPRESDLEFVFNEEKVENNVIKTENSAMIMKKFDTQQKFMSVKNVSSLLNKVNEKGLKAHFESDEEEFFAQILTSKFPLLLLKKFSHKELMTLMMNAAEGEKDLEVKSTSKSKPQRGEVPQQNIKKYHVQNLSCRYCNFCFKSKDELKTHLKTHKKGKFKCAHCSYECNFRSVLKRHMMIHRNIKLYKCSDCSYECNHKGSLKIHMLAHANLKLFKCSHCSYKCNHKSSLKIHMLAHTNVKLFKCSHCSYECNHKGHLRTHMLTHTNLKLFKCSDCSHECNQKGHLRTHMLTHTKVKLFKCSYCSYECNRKDYLKKHKLNKH